MASMKRSIQLDRYWHAGKFHRWETKGPLRMEVKPGWIWLSELYQRAVYIGISRIQLIWVIDQNYIINHVSSWYESNSHALLANCQLQIYYLPNIRVYIPSWPLQNQNNRHHQVQYMYHVVKNTVGMWKRTNRLHSEI